MLMWSPDVNVDGNSFEVSIGSIDILRSRSGFHWFMNEVTVTYFCGIFGQCLLFLCISMGKGFAYKLNSFGNSVLFNIPNDYPYHGIYSIPNIWPWSIYWDHSSHFYLNLTDWNCATDLPQARNQALFDVLLFACIGFINMHIPMSLWPIQRSPEVRMSAIAQDNSRW